MCLLLFLKKVQSDRCCLVGYHLHRWWLGYVFHQDYEGPRCSHHRCHRGLDPVHCPRRPADGSTSDYRSGSPLPQDAVPWAVPWSFQFFLPREWISTACLNDNRRGGREIGINIIPCYSLLVSIAYPQGQNTRQSQDCAQHGWMHFSLGASFLLYQSVSRIYNLPTEDTAVARLKLTWVFVSIFRYACPAHSADKPNPSILWKSL